MPVASSVTLHMCRSPALLPRRTSPLFRLSSPSGTIGQSIVIVDEGGTVKVRPGIMVDGNTTGFAEGDVVVPYVKFPGKRSYSAGPSRPAYDADGEFQWRRKTAKKIYIFF